MAFGIRTGSRKLRLIATVVLMSFVCVLSCGCPHHVSINLPPAPSPSPPPPLETSTFAVKASSSANDIPRLCSQLNSSIPYIISEDPGHQCFQWGCYHVPNRPLQCSAVGNKFHAQVTLEYRGGWRCGLPGGIGYASCGYDSDPAKLATVHTDAVLTWDPAWHLDAIPSTGVNLDNSCKVTIANLPVNGLIQAKIQPAVDRFNSSIPGRVAAATNFRPQARIVWKKLDSAISIGPNMYLMVHPYAAGASNPDVSGNSISLTAELLAHPDLVISSSPPPPGKLVSLPPLQTILTGNEFHIALNGFVSWEAATKLLSKQLVGKTYSTWPFKKVRVKKIAVLGHGNEVLIELTVGGDVDGKLYLHGTPVYWPTSPDGTTDVVTVPNLDFTIQTKNVLANVANWLLHSKLRDNIRAASHFKVANKVEDIQRRLQAGLNQSLSPHIQLHGTVTGVNLRGVYVGSNGLTIQLVADGSADVLYH